MYQRSQRSHDKKFFQVILIISAVSVVTGEVIFYMLYVVCDKSISGIQNHRS